MNAVIRLVLAFGVVAVTSCEDGENSKASTESGPEKSGKSTARGEGTEEQMQPSKKSDDDETGRETREREPCRKVVYERDNEREWIRTYSYDQAGRVKEKKVDGWMTYEIDGEIDAISSYEHDKRGNLVRIEIEVRGKPTRYAPNADKKFDGEPERVEMRDYDEKGRLVTSELDNLTGDDKPNSWDYYSYDESSGHLTARKSDSADPDKVPETIWKFEYDKAGNRVKMKKTDNGESEVVKEYKYGSDGHKIRTKIDGAPGTEVDGEVDEIRKYVYDESGNRVRVKVDGGPPGVPINGDFDVEEKAKYDEAGNLIRLESGNAVSEYEYEPSGCVRPQILSWGESLPDDGA